MDAEAFDRYVTQRYAALVGHVAAMCGDREDAADAVQEALTRAWARRGAFGRHPNKDAWVRTVARNLLVDGWRRRRRHTALTIEPLYDDPDVVARVALRRALAELPAQHRNALVLHYLADLPVADIAEELDAAPGTVRVWLSRGRQQLGVFLDDDQEVHHA